MTRSQQPDEWKPQLMSVADDFDVKDQVLQKIKERKKQAEGKQVKKRLGLIVAAVLVFGGTSAYAAVKVYELRNEQGEVVVKVEQKNDAQKPVRSDNQIATMDDVRNSLTPGESAAVYMAGPDNPDKNISFTRVPVVHETVSALQKEVGGFFHVPEQLAGDYEFAKGDVQYPYPYHLNELFDEMIKEAETEKKNIVVRKVSTEPTIERVNMDYNSKKGEVFVTITNFEKLKWIGDQVAPNEKAEKVKVQNRDALYTVKTVSNGKELRAIQYYKDDKKQLFQVRTNDPDITKEDLLAIAENLK